MCYEQITDTKSICYRISELWCYLYKIHSVCRHRFVGLPVVNCSILSSIISCAATKICVQLTIAAYKSKAEGNTMGKLKYSLLQSKPLMYLFLVKWETKVYFTQVNQVLSHKCIYLIMCFLLIKRSSSSFYSGKPWAGSLSKHI